MFFDNVEIMPTSNIETPRMLIARVGILYFRDSVCLYGGAMLSF